MNNILTASRIATHLRCARRSYWAHEIGLHKAPTRALIFGSAWARAMEARWRGASYDGAFAKALPAGVELSEHDCSTLAALLAGYYERWGNEELVGELHPEVQFSYEIEHGFTVAGKLDCLGVPRLRDPLPFIVESKTTSDDISPESKFWMRLAFNIQVLQYVEAARVHGWDVRSVYYDVTRKPSIQPKLIDDLDERGRKIVLDAQGARVWLGDDKPRLSASREHGWRVSQHVETPDEFSERLWSDCQARASFYFVRREVAVTDDVLEVFRQERYAVSRSIMTMREVQRNVSRPELAWPRSISEDNCDYCPFNSFCLQNISPDKRILSEFEITQNPELTKANDTETTNTTASSPALAPATAAEPDRTADQVRDDSTTQRPSRRPLRNRRHRKDDAGVSRRRQKRVR